MMLFPILLGGMIWAATVAGAPTYFPYKAKGFLLAQTDITGLMAAIQKFPKGDLAILLDDDETVLHVNAVLAAHGMPDIHTLAYQQGAFSGVNPLIDRDHWAALEQAIEERFGARKTACDRYVDYMCDYHDDEEGYDCDELRTIYAEADPDLLDQCQIELNKQQNADEAKIAYALRQSRRWMMS